MDVGSLKVDVLVQVLEMLENGVTPPGIREINDKPPNPNSQPASSQLERKPKVNELWVSVLMKQL